MSAAAAKRQALTERLIAKAAEADDPSTWISLADMTDEEIVAA